MVGFLKSRLDHHWKCLQLDRILYLKYTVIYEMQLTVPPSVIVGDYFMKKRIRYLTDAELEIMRIIWDSDKPMESTEIKHELIDRTWAISTLIGVLAKLEKKGYVKCDKSTRRNLYTARTTEVEYLAAVFSNIRDVHNMRPRDVIEKLYNEQIVSKADLLEIRAFIDITIPVSKQD